MLETVTLQCPYCWETSAIVVDTSVPDQEYIEDCAVCCRPMRLRVVIDAQGLADVTPYHEDE